VSVHKAGVIGASGFVGGELLRLLARHPHIEVALAAAGRQAGRDVADVHPHLASYRGLTLAGPEPDSTSPSSPCRTAPRRPSCRS
jgi:N-acetyl-gamma-glutamylphosphate reductase